jgi:mono/diheme cytochrome c family protein
MVLAMILAVACLFFAGGIFAKVADVIKIENKGCTNTKGENSFSHKKHAEDYVKEYAKLYPNGCGDCHHDDKGKPIAGLKADSKVQSCIDCHKKCGEAPKGKDAPKLEKKAKLDYIAEAYHDNCIGCHKEFNKEFKPKKAPVTCNDCHPKKS